MKPRCDSPQPSPPPLLLSPSIYTYIRTIIQGGEGYPSLAFFLLSFHHPLLLSPRSIFLPPFLPPFIFFPSRSRDSLSSSMIASLDEKSEYATVFKWQPCDTLLNALFASPTLPFLRSALFLPFSTQRLFPNPIPSLIKKSTERERGRERLDPLHAHANFFFYLIATRRCGGSMKSRLRVTQQTRAASVSRVDEERYCAEVFGVGRALVTARAARAHIMLICLLISASCHQRYTLLFSQAGRPDPFSFSPSARLQSV